MGRIRHTNSRRIGNLHGLWTFRWQIAIVAIIYTIVVFVGISVQTTRVVTETLRAQGSSTFDLIYDARTWNAGHGGVWVEKSDTVDTNQWLLKIGIDADISTTDGRDLTLRNPSAMTRELSEITKSERGVTFHLTSFDALNPYNDPDPWELEALESFENGETWAETLDREADPQVYRYMEPLYLDDSCTQCHAVQGYSAGDFRGGISINIPLEEFDRLLIQPRIVLGVLGFLTLVFGASIIQYLVKRLGRKIDEATEQLEHLAVTDVLTQIPNRRATLERLSHEHSRSIRTESPLSVISIDIDHFKSINDTLGHAAGDHVLKEIARRLTESVREYDGIGRIGGEEFLVIAPDTDSKDAHALGERIISAIRRDPFTADEGMPLIVTASAGVATLAADESEDSLLARADGALYDAKDAGRDQIVSCD
ncbi:MAG: diguanylate cyclase [Actinomycetota bacterium]|jgi:diguanylate cyclase (GGDEF)-like protein|nr:diguanylate cyclase [Actinomycetota bacterium]